MRFAYFKEKLKTAVFAVTILLLGVGVAAAQVSLTAQPTTLTLPDGTAVPMWGYTCGAAVTGQVGTCAALNPNAAAGTWSPVLITVQTGQQLTINLQNLLTFTPTGGGAANNIPTSLVIIGQVGGGLGTPTAVPSPSHAQQGVTWATVNTPGGTNPTFTPPPQGPRVQSFGTEVAEGATTPLTWTSLRPGTYLLESGTHPSIQVPMGLYGILVVTTSPTASVATGTGATTETAQGTAYPGVTYDAEVPVELGEIDPVQNTSVYAAVTTAGFSEGMVWSGQPGGCGNATSATYHQCYPPAVNYTPTYYTINGVAFNKTNAPASLFKTFPNSTASATGNILVRLVNAGSRMHVPSMVGEQTNTTVGGVAKVVNGFSIIAEDGNVAPGVPKVQSDVFMAAGKTYDVMIAVPAAGTTGVPIFDRELSLSGNKTARDEGMLAYLSVNNAALPSVPALAAAAAVNDTYNAVVAGQTLTVSDPAKGVLANDFNVYGAKVVGTAPAGLTLNTDGTFVYTGGVATTFTYCGNGTTSGAACATVTLGASTVADSGITCASTTFNSTMATYLAVKTPGVLAGCKDGANLPLTAVASSFTGAGGLTVHGDANGGFTAVAPSAGTYTFTYQVQNSHGQTLATAATSTIIFPSASNLTVNVVDPTTGTAISDYRWVIEEDRTFYINPACTQNPPPSGCPSSGSGIVPTLGVNFHTSYMPFVAQGCTGQKSCEGGQTVFNPATGNHDLAVCDVSNGVCRPDTAGAGNTIVLPGQVHLDPSKRYYISVLPGDSADPFYGANTVGHGMGGAPISCNPLPPVPPATSVTPCTFPTSVTVLTEPSPYPPAKLSVFVFEDDFPLNGEQDGGGGIDVLSPQEPGLGNFQIHLWDAMGGNGDFTGQMTYDMFNQPLSNSLAGTIDPVSGLDACPVSVAPLQNPSDPTATGITGMIVTCPKYEADGVTLSPLAGQAVIANLMPGRFGVVATPGADRIARGEEWLQTNTLDGQKAHDSFVRIGEPSYFQEFGPAGYHVSIGFANPAIINSRHAYVCNGTDPNITGLNCGNTIKGRVVGERLSRTPDERLYGSGSHDAFYWTQCFVSFGDPDGEDFAFTKCDADGNFTLTGLPDGDWRITTFDQWNDQLVDGLSTPVRLSGGAAKTTTNIGDIAATQWQTNLYTRTFADDNHDGISQADEAGISFANVAVRLRDGSLENLLVTDPTGTANFNETFPLFSWYTVETDVTRYKNTGTHVVYDVGGPADGSLSCGVAGYPPCGTSTIGKFLANTAEKVSLPTNLRFPGAVYCKDADCSSHTGSTASLLSPAASSDPPSSCTTSNTGVTTCSTILSSGRVDPPWVGVEGWQGFPGQNNFIEFGKEPYVPGENGGIKGHVVYASTRPFDDPQLLVQTQWEPLVPNVTINLYQEGFASDGVTPTLNLVDTTVTSSWDNWAQGFRADGVTPNMNCPGQGAASGAIPDLFFFSLYNQPQWLDFYNSQHGGPAAKQLPNNAQFKCYDGMHNWNQIQPAPYDGMYQFPSVTSIDANGKPNGTNCKICSPNHAVATTDLYYGLPMLPTGKYVVEVVVPPGFELVKEEDKNILIGDNFIAPATQEFGGLGNVFILPDQASLASQGYTGPGYNANNAQNPTQSFGTTPSNNIVPGFIPEPTWPCVGEARIVPDYISLYPLSKQIAPFAGATRNLCDRKEVTLNDQMGAIAKFYVYTSTHIASKYTGGITDDYTSEFDPFSPTFGEKFSPPDLPVSLKDWKGYEISRTYADHWGSYDGMTYSTWEVNPPNPTGYSPTMMVVCMNDPGPISNGASMITDPLFAQGYSQFCYELPFMPGTTQYLDTPVVPTSAFAGAGYNNVDCAYPTLTPAVSEVDGSGVGPWVSGFGQQITINALGDQMVPNNAYNGPSATTAPYNQKTILRHYGFGASQGTGSVTVGGVPLQNVSWSDTKITGTVVQSAGGHNMPQCAVQQQAQYGGSTAYCGQLVITAGNGQQSIDSVTVTIGGKAPTHIAATASIQAAIDSAKPGDLLIVDPTCTSAAGPVACTPFGSTAGVTNSNAAHNEMVLMWKPVRLQGVGAASSIINANTHPAGKLDAWRRQVNCLFGLALNGSPVSGTNVFDPTQNFTCAANMQGAVDRLPLEAVVGWDASLNGNLAELLQEPSLMGALEGAAITVLAKGVDFHGQDQYASSLAGGFPTGTTLLLGNPQGQNGTFATGDNNRLCVPKGTNPFPSNFQCNPSSIDGIGITDSSQGGGGIFVHGWGHNIQIANDRIYNNAGTLSGGINVGQGEFPPAYIAGGGATNAAPGSCMPNLGPAGIVQPYCHDINVNVHNNYISLNSSTGDELFSATPAGAGGVSFCTGADFYKFNNNWVCGNLSSGDGGGFGHLGLSYNADIEHNAFVFNQSINPTIPANGGGLVIMGAPDVDPTCGAQTDQDCVPAVGSVGPSDGIGPNMTINANLIMGNAAETGTGGGISFQNVNGSDVVSFPTNPNRWHHVSLTNNIITNNVAGWDGGGVSLLDALNVDVVNNTISSNNSTASAGILFTTIGAPLASQQGSNCMSTSTTSCPQVAGLVSEQNSLTLTSNLPKNVRCPDGHYAGNKPNNANCRAYSYPLLTSNVFWQNSSYYIGVGALSAQYQQNVVSLYNAFTTTLACNPQTGVGCQKVTGDCEAASYWDIGVRGDTGPTNHSGGATLNPMYSVLSPSETGYSATNINTNPSFMKQYCNGSRTPPESGASGWQVPPGISDATVPNPIFNLTPVATVDEGNNWINLRWGPLSMVNPVSNAVLGNYALAAGSPAIDHVPTSVSHPSTDYFGNPRPETNADRTFDAGAVEFGSTSGGGGGGNATVSITPNPLTITLGATQFLGSGVVTLTNTSPAGGPSVTVSNVTVGGLLLGFFETLGSDTCTGTTLAPGASCTVGVSFFDFTRGTSHSSTITFTDSATGSPQSGTITGTRN